MLHERRHADLPVARREQAGEQHALDLETGRQVGLQALVDRLLRGTQRLPRLVGPARAKDLIFSGRFVDSAEALAIGLVDEVAPADDVYTAAVARMQRYVGGPAYALRAAKEAIDGGTETDLATGLEIERMLFAGLFATRDREIGMASFVEHGPGKAQFEGR